MPPNTERGPALLNGMYVGTYLSSGMDRRMSKARVTITFDVEGDTFTGTFKTDEGAEGTTAGTIVESSYEGTCIRTNSDCPGKFRMWEIWGPTSTLFHFDGKHCLGQERGQVTVHRMNP